MDLDRLAAAVPPHVRDVCTKLTEAGHQAVVVGGCVRDVLMGRMPVDWDVASSAPPEAVLALFKRTRPQGLQHGTVVVEMGRHKDAHIEVTTFRGEGAYSDARRPDSVTFGVPLVEDLARRDLVVNAIAYDPAKNELIDPFDGQGDIAARRLRAVGRAVDRFTEDGLRVMRAVRFAAQLEFVLDPETEAGIPPALPSLEKVSRERVCDELRKLLKAREPSRGLAPAWRTGIIASILPALAASVTDVDAWLARIDRADRDVRLAAMLVPLADPKRAGELLRALKFSNAEAELAQQILGVVDTARLDPPSDEGVRRLLARVDKPRRSLAVALWVSAQSAPQMIVDVGRRILDENHPLAVGDLAITGKDLMTALSMKPGPALGRILEGLRDFVIEDPARNARDTLLAEAQRLELQVGH
jgi:tRNA nucleotidyltransferase (CCA-adding enzyme)